MTDYTYVLSSTYRGLEDQSLADHIESFFRLTYRIGFESFSGYPFGSDAGWGCMLRAGQMLLAHTLIRHFFGPNWRLKDTTKDGERSIRNEILRWFMDYSNSSYWYSLHQMVHYGLKYDKSPGEWYGPSTVAYIMRDLCQLHQLAGSGPIQVFVTQGDTFYYSEVNKQMEKKESSNETIARSVNNDNNDSNNNTNNPTNTTFFDPLFNRPPNADLRVEWTGPLLLLIPLRLGIEGVNIEYEEDIRHSIRHSNCVGIMGGRPNHAMYFIGYNTRNQLLGLDPHTVFSTPPVDEMFPRPELLSQIHVRRAELLDWSQLDPSLTIGFYFANRQEFDAFYDENQFKNQEYKKKQAKSKCRANRPIFTIEHSPPAYVGTNDSLDLAMDEPHAEGEEDDEYVFV